jgi:hypothetical protein
MKIILSRKGFDSSSVGGGCPSPVFEDGTMLSFPIPDIDPGTQYQNIRWQHGDLGFLVNDLTKGKIKKDASAHLDPDLRKESLLKRDPAWRPLLGQSGAAQGHLRNNNVGTGDIFLFFGLFQNVRVNNGRYEWDRKSPWRHVIWGWLQVDEVLDVEKVDRSKYPWAMEHPHFRTKAKELNNTVYVARHKISLPLSKTSIDAPGAGVFTYLKDDLVLTDNNLHDSPRNWILPEWFYSEGGKTPLTYHPNPLSWKKDSQNGLTKLKCASIGQEFILDAENYRESIDWIAELLALR